VISQNALLEPSKPQSLPLASVPSMSDQETRSSVDATDTEAERELVETAPRTWSAEDLTALCNAYWYPLYAFLRRSGRGPQDADALIARFLSELRAGKLPPETAALEIRSLRTFLLECGKSLLVSYDDISALQEEAASSPTWEEESYAKESTDLEPEPLFERRWAMSVLNHALQVLRDEFSKSGKESSFDQLKHLLGFGPDPEEEYQKMAAKLGIDVSTVKHQVFRLRCRWRELLLEQIAQTLFSPSKEEINDELMQLLGSV